MTERIGLSERQNKPSNKDSIDWADSVFKRLKSKRSLKIGHWLNTVQCFRRDWGVRGFDTRGTIRLEDFDLIAIAEASLFDCVEITVYLGNRKGQSISTWSSCGIDTVERNMAEKDVTLMRLGSEQLFSCSCLSISWFFIICRDNRSRDSPHGCSLLQAIVWLIF